MVPLYNGFYPFPLSRAVNSNSLIFDPSEFKIGLYIVIYPDVFLLRAFVSSMHYEFIVPLMWSVFEKPKMSSSKSGSSNNKCAMT